MEEFLQQKVNEIAAALIAEFPEIARDDPAEIGKMAKEIVFGQYIKQLEADGYTLRR